LARALASKPSFIILDEPVSALDVSIRGQILNLFKSLQEELGIAYLLIAHDLGLTIHLSHSIEVLYAGLVMQSIASEELYQHALHPYTKALLKSASLVIEDQRNRLTLPGEVPDPLNPPPGCRFHPRCPYKMPKCSAEEPVLKPLGKTHAVRCHLHA
jgi:oligopeptide/dipeptide ABC transporter ATP-binding protein